MCDANKRFHVQGVESVERGEFRIYQQAIGNKEERLIHRKTKKQIDKRN